MDIVRRKYMLITPGSEIFNFFHTKSQYWLQHVKLTIWTEGVNIVRGSVMFLVMLCWLILT